MNEDVIQKNYLKKIKELNNHNYYYFNKNNPIINDAEYDKLKSEIIELEKKYNFLKKKIHQQKMLDINHLKILKN